MTDNQKFAFESILKRRSVRRFVEDKQVEKWKIIKLLEAAMAAPSACNTQPWEFIVISDKGNMEQLRNAAGSAKEFNAPLAVITCANTANTPWESNGWMIDCSAAVENMLIAATAMGLASLWVGWCQEDILRQTFDIPKHIHFLNITFFGYTDEILQSGTRYSEDAVFWEKYDPTRIRPQKKVIDYGSVQLNDLSVNPPASWED